ncbi:element excision factor XisI family protein [Nostoc sp.]
MEAQTIFDGQQDHYQLIYIDWQNRRRVFVPVMHFDPPVVGSPER